MKNRISVSLLIFLFCTVAYAASPLKKAVKVNSSGITNLYGIFDKQYVSVNFTTHEVTIKSNGELPSKRLNSCTHSRIPCSIVDSIELSVNNLILFVPLSIYSDLSDINQASLYKNKDLFVLNISGGDASESYSVEILFNKAAVIQRARFAEETDQITEKTIYYSPPVMD